MQSHRGCRKDVRGEKQVSRNVPARRVFLSCGRSSKAKCRDDSFLSATLPRCIGGTLRPPTSDHRVKWPCRTQKGETCSNPGLVAHPRAPMSTRNHRCRTPAHRVELHRPRVAGPVVPHKCSCTRERFPLKSSGLAGAPMLGSPCPHHQRVSSSQGPSAVRVYHSLLRAKMVSRSHSQPKARLQSHVFD